MKSYYLQKIIENKNNLKYLGVLWKKSLVNQTDCNPFFPET